MQSSLPMVSVLPSAGPVFALIGLTLVVLFYMYSQRIPAMQKMGIEPDEARDNPGMKDTLPPSARYSSGNLINLFEMPVLFYALWGLAAFYGLGTDLFNSLAWSYAALRILHSVIQCTYNKIIHRWAIFMLSSIVLAVLYGHTVMTYLERVG